MVKWSPFLFKLRDDDDDEIISWELIPRTYRKGLECRHARLPRDSNYMILYCLSSRASLQRGFVLFEFLRVYVLLIAFTLQCTVLHYV